MAFAVGFDALSSLENTIECLVNSSRIFIESPSEEILDFAYVCVRSVREYLEKLDSGRGTIQSESINALEGGIAEAARKLEDVIESHVSDQFLSQSEESFLAAAGDDEQHGLWFSLDLQEIRQDIDCFTEKVEKMDKFFVFLYEEEEEEEEGDGGGGGDVSPIITDLAGNETEMAGISDEYRDFRDELITNCASKAASIFGMEEEEEYIKELDNLFPQEPDDDEADADAVSSRTDFAGSDSDENEIPYQYRKLIFSLMNWLVAKAALIFGTKEYFKKLDNPLMPDEEEDDDDGASSSKAAFSGSKSKMVGLYDEFCEIRDELLQRDIEVVAITGMAGIGKTTLAMKIFEDKLILRNFECRAFVKVGQKPQLKGILQVILAQVNFDNDKMLIEGDEKQLGEHLRKSLSGRKSLIVLDDVWDLDFAYGLTDILPDEDNGSKILLTTRLGNITISIFWCCIYHMRFLNKEESWDLFREMAFAQEVCPRQLEKVGKKIAENCEGLPLLIITVAHLLSKADRTLEYWNKVAANKQNFIFINAYDQISKVLYPSYNYLPQELKTFFLYMAAFPQNCEVGLSGLMNLLSAEGSLNVSYEDMQHVVERCFEKLVSSNLVLACQRSRFSNKLKACSLHSVFWHLCKREAQNNQFLHIFNSFSDALAEGAKTVRCLSIYKNILFSIKDVFNSMASISTARLLLCTGPHHQYQVPICFSLRLLRVLDALTIRLYEFPVEVLKLVHLRYLALTCNANLPPSISQLWNLQCLIVHQYFSIKYAIVESYLPVEIWDLQELNYLQIMGRNLPHPPPGAVLKNLLTLLNVGTHSCTKSIFESIPNLNKLRVQIELAPDVAEPFRCFDHISNLNELMSLQCVVVNPNLRSEIVAPPSPLSLSTSCLTKLTVSGFGYPWKDMKKIADLQFLKVLKLQCYAFQGEKWEAEEYVFQSLQYLSIEDTDLVQWSAGYKTFSTLYWLSIKNCYKLQQIPKISSLEDIELIDCNPLAMICAMKMEDHGRHVYVDSSFLV